MKTTKQLIMDFYKISKSGATIQECVKLLHASYNSLSRLQKRMIMNHFDPRPKKENRQIERFIMEIKKEFKNKK